MKKYQKVVTANPDSNKLTFTRVNGTNSNKSRGVLESKKVKNRRNNS